MDLTAPQDFFCWSGENLNATDVDQIPPDSIYHPYFHINLYKTLKFLPIFDPDFSIFHLLIFLDELWTCLRYFLFPDLQNIFFYILPISLLISTRNLQVFNFVHLFSRLFYLGLLFLFLYFVNLTVSTLISIRRPSKNVDHLLLVPIDMPEFDKYYPFCCSILSFHMLYLILDIFYIFWIFEQRIIKCHIV